MRRHTCPGWLQPAPLRDCGPTPPGGAATASQGLKRSPESDCVCVGYAQERRAYERMQAEQEKAAELARILAEQGVEAAAAAAAAAGLPFRPGAIYDRGGAAGTAARQAALQARHAARRSSTSGPAVPAPPPILIAPWRLRMWAARRRVMIIVLTVLRLRRGKGRSRYGNKLDNLGFLIPRCAGAASATAAAPVPSPASRLLSFQPSGYKRMHGEMPVMLPVGPGSRACLRVRHRGPQGAGGGRDAFRGGAAQVRGCAGGAGGRQGAVAAGPAAAWRPPVHAGGGAQGLRARSRCG